MMMISHSNNVSINTYVFTGLGSIKNLELKTEATKARYVKVKAYNYGKLPEWHQGAGGDAFIFVDEIEVK